MGNGVARQHGHDAIFNGTSLEALTRLADTGRYLSPPRRSPSPSQHPRRAPTHPDALAASPDKKFQLEDAEKTTNDTELCYRFPEKHVPRSRPNSPPPPPPLPLPLPLQMPATPRAARRHIKAEEDTRDWDEFGPAHTQHHDDTASTGSQSSLEGSPVPWAQGQMEIIGVGPRKYEDSDKDSFSSRPASPALWSPSSSRPASPRKKVSSRPASPGPLQVRCLTPSAQPQEKLHSSRPASPPQPSSRPSSPRSPPPECRPHQRQGPQWRSRPLQTPPLQSTPKIGLSPPQMLMTPSLPQLPPLQPPLVVPPCAAGLEPMFGASRSVASCTTTTPSSPQGVRITSPHPGWQSARSSVTSLGHALVTEQDSRDSGMVSERWQSPRRLPPPSDLPQGSWVAGAWPHQSDAVVQRAHFQVRMLPPAHSDLNAAANWLAPGACEMAPITPSTPSALASVVPSPHGRVRLHPPPHHASKNTLELAALSHRVKSVLRKCKSQLERPQGGTPITERGNRDKVIDKAGDHLGQIGRDLFELHSNIEAAHEKMSDEGCKPHQKQVQLAKSVHSPDVVQDAEGGADISFGGILNSSMRSTCTFGMRDPSPEGSGLYTGDSPQHEVKRPHPDQADVCFISTSASSSSSGSPLSDTSARQHHIMQSRQSNSAVPVHRPEPPTSIPHGLTPRRQDVVRRSSEPVSNDIAQRLRKQQHMKAHDSPAAMSADYEFGARARRPSAPGLGTSAGDHSRCAPHADRARAASANSRAVSPFHARIASNCDALESEMIRTREERSRRANKVQRLMADSKAPRRTITTQQLPAPPMEAPWVGHLS